MTQVQKEQALKDKKAEAFDVFQSIEHGKVYYNQLMQEINQIMQAPTEDEVEDKTDGVQ
jgi:uncharacterized protein (DUF2164 family)